MNTWVQKLKPFILVTFLQFGLAGMDLISKAALNGGTSNYVLVVYRHAVATVVIAPFAIVLDRRTRPKMTLPIFIRLMALGLLEPVIDQNLYYLGIKHTTATFGASMSNILPAMTFVMACIMRLEMVKMRSIWSQAKVFGTLATVAGAMIMTLVKGPVLQRFQAQAMTSHDIQSGGANGGITLQNSIKGALMITAGMFCWSCFMILQAVTLPTYPTELSLTAWICFLGTVEGAVLAVIMEKGNAAVWSIHWDAKLLAAVYSGIVCSGLGYYVQGVVMKERGPVFVTAFSPLSMVIVAVLSTFILAEHLTLGRIIGAIVIVAGLYLVVWGKSKDNQSSDEETALPSELADPRGIDEETALPGELADPRGIDEETALPTDLADRGGYGTDKDNQSSDEETALPSELPDPRGIDEETALPSELADPRGIDEETALPTDLADRGGYGTDNIHPNDVV